MNIQLQLGKSDVSVHHASNPFPVCVLLSSLHYMYSIDSLLQIVVHAACGSEFIGQFIGTSTLAVGNEVHELIIKSRVSLASAKTWAPCKPRAWDTPDTWLTA